MKKLFPTKSLLAICCFAIVFYSIALLSGGSTKSKMVCGVFIVAWSIFLIAILKSMKVFKKHSKPPEMSPFSMGPDGKIFRSEWKKIYPSKIEEML